MLQSVRNGWVSSEKRRSKRREKRKNTKGTRAREPWRCYKDWMRERERASERRKEEKEREKPNEQYKEGVKKRVRNNKRERERRKRTRLGAMCVGERIHIVRFGGKVFGQVQGDAAAGSLLSSCASFCPFILSLSHHLVSSPLLYEEKRPSLPPFTPFLFLTISRARPSGLFVSFRFSSLEISL